MKVNKTTLFILCVVLISTLLSVQVLASDTVNYKELPAGFELTVTAPEFGDFYQIWVGKKGVTEEDINSISDEQNFEEKIGYVDFAAAKTKDEILFSMDLSHTNEYGKYTVVLITTAAGGDTDTTRDYYIYRFKDPNLAVKAISVFAAVDTQEEFVTALKEYSVEPNDFFLPDDLDIFADENTASEAGEYFAKVRDLVYGENESFSVSKDILDCAYAAYTLSELFGNSVKDAKYAVENYGSFIKEYLPAAKNTEAFMKLLSVVKPYISDSETLGHILSVACTYVEKADANAQSFFETLSSEIKSVDDFEIVTQWSLALGGFVDATREEIEQVISDNAVLFGIDISADANYGISLAQVAQRFDTTKADDLYGKEAFSKYYDSLAKAIADEEKQKTEDNEDKKVSNRATNGIKNVTVKPDEPTVNDATPNIESLPAQSLPFNDISGCAWAHEHIKTLYDKGIVSGVDKEHFEPERYVTRAEFVKMLVVALNVTPDNDIQFGFDDVSKDTWFYPYISVAYRAGWVNGVNKNYFGALETITREDAAVMIARVINIAGTSEPQFTDADQVSDYALSAVSAISETGIMNGVGGGCFNPKGFTTRAEAATIIARVMKEV